MAFIWCSMKCHVLICKFIEWISPLCVYAVHCWHDSLVKTVHAFALNCANCSIRFICCVPFSIGTHTLILSLFGSHVPITILQFEHYIILFILAILASKQCWFSLKFQQMVHRPPTLPKYSAVKFFVFSVRFDSHCIPVEFDRRRTLLM